MDKVKNSNQIHNSDIIFNIYIKYSFNSELALKKTE